MAISQIIDVWTKQSMSQIWLWVKTTTQTGHKMSFTSISIIISPLQNNSFQIDYFFPWKKFQVLTVRSGDNFRSMIWAPQTKLNNSPLKCFGIRNIREISQNFSRLKDIKLYTGRNWVNWPFIHFKLLHFK